MKRIKYIVKYQKGTRKKQVTGFVRVPKDLPENFTADQLIEFLSEKHKISKIGLEIKLLNYVSKSLNYGSPN